GALTDVTARRIIDEVIAPRFRSGDFAGGIDAGLTRIIGVIDGEPLPLPAPEATHGRDFDWNNFGTSAAFFLFGGIVAGGILRALLGRLVGSVAAATVVGVLAWAVLGSLLAALLIAVLAFMLVMFGGGGTSTGLGRGGYGGGWSGGSSGSSGGGFSGGGGSFGGGGASGSW
ncbi:MAG: TPM domain-containing protein, partial [Bradyrhizobium sp.]|uniref:TPM domain-containing protein n=1 Tax=Bradyrhizobium sp. TaxID=376 RepID=UPI001D7E1C4A